MSADQTIHVDVHDFSIEGLSDDRQCDRRTAAAGTSGKHHALVLGIHVQKDVAFDRGQVDGMRTVHADFLGYRADELQPRMAQRLRIQQSQCIGHGDAVIAAERRSLCADVIAVDLQVQAFLLHIFRDAGILLADHVHMALQNDRLLVLIAFGSLFDDDHVVQFVLIDLKSAVLCKFHQVIADCLLMIGRSRDLCQILEKMKYGFRFNIFQYSHVAVLPVLRLRIACSDFFVCRLSVQPAAITSIQHFP